MKCHIHTPQKALEYIINPQLPPGSASCINHDFQCSKYSLFCCYNTAKASYKTYAFVYLFQLIINSKKFRANPKKQIPRFIINYIKSVSFTAIDFLIMRRVMCLYQKYIGGDPKSLIISNILGGLYLGIETKNRQIQISLYALNKTIQTVYNGYKRRNPNFKVPYGQVFLFAISIAIISYHYFSNKQVFRPAYEKAFGSLFKNV